MSCDTQADSVQAFEAKVLLESPAIAKAITGPSKYLSWCVSTILRAHRPPDSVYGEPIRMNDQDRFNIAVQQLKLRRVFYAAREKLQTEEAA